MDPTSLSPTPLQRTSNCPATQRPQPPRQHLKATEALSASLTDLAAMVTVPGGLSDILERVATYAAHAIPGADGAGITLLDAGRPDNRLQASAASDPFVTQIDQIQHRRVNEGPCITATRERHTVRSGSLREDTKWPQFGPRIARSGIQSAMSLPLLIPGQVIGAISVYARAEDAFDDHAQELGELFAAPAAVAVHNAHVLSQAIALATQLQTSLAARPVIDEAIGLIRARTGLSSVQARERLQAMSQQQQLKMIVVAQHVVDEAVRRALARG